MDRGPMTKPLKAYAVLEEGENTGGIVFAAHAIVARRQGAAIFGDGEFEGVSCRRAPWADHCAKTGVVPVSLMIDHGWRFECYGCGATIDRDWLYDMGLPLLGVIGTQHSSIFCCDSCRSRHKAREAVRCEIEADMIERLKAMVLRRLPGAEICSQDQWASRAHAEQGWDSGAWAVNGAVVFFAFPGMRIGPASLVLRRDYLKINRIGPIDPSFECCAGDQEAFEAFAAETRRQPETSP